MGTDLGQLCHELRDELLWLQHKWTEFQELFGKGPERIDLLNAVAPHFFYIVRRLLFEDAMLHLCRLTDPPEPKVRGEVRSNLTVMMLPKLISDPALRASVSTAAERVRQSCEFAREWRNRWLAHTDLETFRNEQASTLPPVTSSNIEDGLESMRALLNSIDERYGLPPSGLLPDPFGVRSLVFYLEEGTRGGKRGSTLP